MREFKEVYSIYFDVLVNYLSNYLLKKGNSIPYLQKQQIAEELVNNVFLRILNKDLENLLEKRKRSKIEMKNYLYLCVKREGLDFLRRHKEVVRLDTSYEKASMIIVQEDYDYSFDEKVTKVFQLLTADEKKILHMFYFERKKHKEIAVSLGLPVNQVGMVLKRLRKKALKKYTNQYGEVA